MAELILGPRELERMWEIVSYARANPIQIDRVREGAVTGDPDVIELKDRKPGFVRPATQHMVFSTVDGRQFRAAFSIEQQPAGLCKHLSVSTFGPKKGILPLQNVVYQIAALFGLSMPFDKVWREEYDVGAYALNMLSLCAPTHEGNA